MTHRRTLTAALATLSLVLVLAGPARAARGDWELGFFGGLYASGELFTAVSEDTRGWFTPDGRRIEGTEIQTELDEFAGGGVRLRRGLSDLVSVALGVGLADMGVTAVRRTSTNDVDEVDYDQAFVILADLTVHYDLTPTGNRPYVLAGVGLANVDFEERGDGDSIDQSGLGISLGAGYRIRSVEGFHFDVEVRDTFTSFDADPEEERLAPEEFRSQDRIHVWQITASWVFGF